MSKKKRKHKAEKERTDDKDDIGSRPDCESLQLHGGEGGSKKREKKRTVEDLDDQQSAVRLPPPSKKRKLKRPRKDAEFSQDSGTQNDDGRKKKKSRGSKSKRRGADDAAAAAAHDGTIGNAKDDGVVAPAAHEEDDDEESGKPTGVTFPFPTLADDHCESPVEAYADIAPFLKYLQEHNPGGNANLRIYDPYYCDGSVIRHLASLGFPDVYNRMEDCYETWRTIDDTKSRTMSQFDVLVTNPPYSGDHMERLLTFAASSQWGDRPWFLLLPNFVHKKDYYQQLLLRSGTAKNHLRNQNDTIRPFYLVPDKRYVYVPPKQFRAAKKSDVHKKSSPFVSMWYCWGGSPTRNEALIRSFYDRHGAGGGGQSQSLTLSNHGACQLARSRSALRDLRRKR